MIYVIQTSWDPRSQSRLQKRRSLEVCLWALYVSSLRRSRRSAVAESADADVDHLRTSSLVLLSEAIGSGMVAAWCFFLSGHGNGVECSVCMYIYIYIYVLLVKTSGPSSEIFG